ncbi:MAG: nucleotidyltransferase domain-containing protein [bacterium]|nr:nucleotidyltransferase domain-containing protein [bacterium]
MTRRLILRELVRIGDSGLHLRELARKTGLDASGVRKELKNLISAGVVIEKPIGNLKIFSLNKKSPIFSELKMLIVKTIGIADEIRDALQSLKGNIDIAYIYGSFASGTESPSSDIDLLVVGNLSLKQVVSAVSEVGRKLSREINPTVLTNKEFYLRLSQNDGFIVRINSGDKIELINKSNES